MKLNRTIFRGPQALFALATAVALIAAACGGGSEGELVVDVQDADPAAVDRGSATGDPVYDFPTGDAVLVAAGYQHPNDHVDNTGAYLPTNGKPTVVFVDAIW